METNTNLIAHLREMATADHGVCEMMHWMLDRLSLDASKGRIKVVTYLQKAFDLSLADAAAAGAWHVFPGGTWSDEECEQFLIPRIRSTRSQWMQTPL